MMVFIQLLSIQIIACVKNQTVYVRQYKKMSRLFLALLLLACLFILSRDRDNKHVREQTELLAPMSLCICHAFPQSECVIGLEHVITDSGISLQDYKKRVKANILPI